MAKEASLPSGYDGIIPKKERMTYYFGGLGQGMMYACMSSYISDFYLNVMGLAAGFVTFLTLASRIWDAINDPIMGTVMDRFRPKRGYMKGYLFWSPIPIAALTMLLFIVPNIPVGWKMVYAAVTYVLWDFFYTIGDIPFWALPNAMTPNPNERGRVISISRTTNGIGSAVPMFLFMGLGYILPSLGLAGNGLEKVKYLVMAGIACVVGGGLFYRTCFGVQERVEMRSAMQADKESGELPPNALKLVFGCKPLVMTILMGILASGRYLYQAGAIHAARYTFVMNPDSLAGKTGAELEKAIQSNISTVSLVLTIVVTLGMFGSMLAVPSLMKKLNYKQLIMGSALIGGVSGIILFLLKYNNFWLCLPFIFFASIPLGVINVVSYAMIGDSLDYMEWQTGYRQTGIGQACQTFVNKFSNAIATASITLTYGLIGLDKVVAASAEATINPLNLENGMRGGIFSLVSLVPSISMLLCTIPLLWYNMTGQTKARVTQELAEARAARGAVRTAEDTEI
ncbi:MAG: MFS transporter [Oscillospiraceae bacterium]|jgi:Na+/melibiose symporter-like transporter|nr:MFS transporter [Oscillospiraceae bacterium]